jgi:hypothetical protein
VGLKTGLQQDPGPHLDQNLVDYSFAWLDKLKQHESTCYIPHKFYFKLFQN